MENFCYPDSYQNNSQIFYDQNNYSQKYTSNNYMIEPKQWCEIIDPYFYYINQWIWIPKLNFRIKKHNPKYHLYVEFNEFEFNDQYYDYMNESYSHNYKLPYSFIDNVKFNNDKFNETTKTCQTSNELKWYYDDMIGCHNKHNSKYITEIIKTNKHDSNHDNIKYYHCNIGSCTYKSKYNSGLKKHKAFVHNIDVKFYHCCVEGCMYKSKYNCKLKKHKIITHSTIHLDIHNYIYTSAPKRHKKN